MKILFKFPSRSRPNKLKEALLNIQDNVASTNYTILLTIDDDDKSFDSDLYEWITINIRNVALHTGTSNNKTHAINRGIWVSPDFDILVCMSDDMQFQVKGFDDIIRKDMEENFPDLDGVLHYNDGMQKSNVMTMSIMGHKYCANVSYKIYGLDELVIYHPEYESVWSDVEATEMAYMLDKYKYMGNDKIIFKHLHPVWQLAEWDEQYRKSEDKRVYIKDHEVITKRRSINYGIPNDQLKKPFKYATL